MLSIFPSQLKVYYLHFEDKVYTFIYAKMITVTRVCFDTTGKRLSHS